MVSCSVPVQPPVKSARRMTDTSARARSYRTHRRPPSAPRRGLGLWVVELTTRSLALWRHLEETYCVLVDDITEQFRRHYAETFETYGASPRGIDWRDGQDGVDYRYAKML